MANKISNKKPSKKNLEIVTHSCTYCGRTTSSEYGLKQDFYMTNHKFMKNKRSPLCKECVLNLSTVKDAVSITKFKEVLEFINKPYYETLFISSIEENRGKLDLRLNNEEMMFAHGRDIVKMYMKNIAMPQYRGLGFDSSDKDGSNLILEHITTDDGIIITDKIRTLWGIGLDDWEYEYLEKEIIKLKASFECPDYGMEMIMKDISFFNLDIMKVRLKNEDPNKTIEARTKLMDKAKMNPVQSTGADASDQITFGMLINKLENERPTGEARSEWKDPDNFKYWNTIFTGHLAKMNDISSPIVTEYEKLVEPYTVSIEDIEEE